MLISKPIKISNKRGSKIPQHPLLTRRQWNRLRKEEIKQLTYWATYGPTNYLNKDEILCQSYKHAFSVIIRKEDAP